MRRLFLFLVILICYLSCFSQEVSINQKRSENFRNISTGMSPDEIISILSFETEINKSFFGGIFIGIGLLSKDYSNPSSYSGNLNLNEYIFIFDNGKLKGKSIDSTKIGSKTISGQYVYEFIGKTQTSWSLVNGKFNSNTVAINYTEEEKRIKDEQYAQRKIKSDNRLKEVTDSLTKNGYKIITEKGFDSFEIKKTKMQEIISTLGPNYLREDRKKDYLTKISYPELGIRFYVEYDKKTENGLLREIRLRSPFKGYFIEGYLENNFWGVALNKTTLKDFMTYWENSIQFKWEDENNCEFISHSRYNNETNFVIVLESPNDTKSNPNNVINEFRIFDKSRSRSIHLQGF